MRRRTDSGGGRARALTRRANRRPFLLAVANSATARHVRAGLQEARRRGLPFTEAWNEVVKVALLEVPGDERSGWRMALRDTAGAWEMNYGD